MKKNRQEKFKVKKKSFQRREELIDSEIGKQEETNQKAALKQLMRMAFSFLEVEDAHGSPKFS